MSQRPTKGRRTRHGNRFSHGTEYRRHMTSGTYSGVVSYNNLSNRAAIDGSSSVSFDMLSVESATPATAILNASATNSGVTGFQTVQSSATPTVDVDSGTMIQSAQISITNDQPLSTATQAATSFERTTLIVSPTFSVLGLLTSNPATTAAPFSAVAAGALSGSLSVGSAMTSTRPGFAASQTTSASTTYTSAAQPSALRPHLPVSLIVFIVFGGLTSLGLCLYVFKRMRYKALHVSRSQFQIASDPGAVPGSTSDRSFVSGGLGRSRIAKHQKNRFLDNTSETPLWGGKEMFSPQIDTGVVDYPPAVHFADGLRAPMKHRRSMMQAIRNYGPINRLSKHGPGWSAIPGSQDFSVPTVKVTDMDTQHSRLPSNSTFSSAVDGSPDPNLATIQVASVTRTLSAAASYHVNSPPPTASGLDHPRPAPKIPVQAPPLNRLPLAPKVPGIAVSERAPSPAEKKLDASGRGKIAVADISKPQPVVPLNPEFSGEADPMIMYAKYTAGLGLREGSPKREPVRHESSMAKKIAQIAHTKPAVAATDSQTSLSNRDTRALAAAAGVASPIPGENHTFSVFNGNQISPFLPVSPGLGEVGNTMLRPFGQAGSMLPAFLDTPAIGLDNRASYSMADVSGSSLTVFPPQSIGGRATPSTLIAEPSAGTLSPSMPSDDHSRRTIASAYSQDWIPLSQQAHMLHNPDYKSPTYSIYNYYGPDRVSTVPRVPSMAYSDREESHIGGAM